MPSVQFTRLRPGGHDPVIVAKRITHWYAHEGGSQVFTKDGGFLVSEPPGKVKALVDAALMQLAGADHE